MSKLTVLMGAPGSGKSTYAKRYANVVTQDRLRPQAAGDIVHESYKRVNELLAAGKDVVFDGTSASAATRKALVGIARKHGADAHLCVLDTPLKTCLDVQKGRARPVADGAVRSLHANVQRQIPQLQNEGFKSITISRDRK